MRTSACAAHMHGRCLLGLRDRIAVAPGATTWPSSDYEIALATRADIAGILELQEQNLRENGGHAVGALHSRVVRGGARRHAGDRGPQGRDASSATWCRPRRRHRRHVPIVAGDAAGLSGSARCLPLRPHLRGRERARAGPAGRADVGVARAAAGPARASPSSASDNVRSMRAHAKIGMRQVAEFMHADAAIVVVVYPG